MPAHPLAYCPTCKVVFPIAPPEGGTVVFKNSTTSCPNGHFSRILKGGHQAFEAELQAAVGIHHQTIRQPILALWGKLSRGEITPVQAQAEAEQAKPGLGVLFNPANSSDPVKKAIVEALIADLGAEAEPSAEPPAAPQIVVANPAPASSSPEAARVIPMRPKGGNRAFQRRLRHQHRVLMNPRVR
jgi:hypothetical protein